MTAVLLTPLTGQFFDNNGNPLNGGLVYSYVAGTSFGTPLATYTNATGSIPAANPVVLNSAGRADIWGAGTYDFKITDSLGNTIDTISSVTAIFGSGDMTKAVYDPANISQQLVGLTAVQTLTNKTLTSPTLTSPISDKITFNSTSGVIGTTTNDNAAAGSVGELISSATGSGSAVSLTNNITANVTSISVTAGDWYIYGNVATLLTGGTTVTYLGAAITSTSATFPSSPNNGALAVLPFTTTVNATIPAGMMRVSVPTTTTYYLVAFSTFSGGTNGVYGFLGARRVR